MGRRAWRPDAEGDAAKLTLGELEQRIAKAEYDLTSSGKSNLRKLAFKSLVHLEALRETLHGIPAPKRSLRSRQ
jgi:hypothetical protein